MTEEILKTVLFLKKTAGFPVRKSLEVLGLPSRTYYRWGVTQGKGKRPEGGLPKGHWIFPEEREAILSFMMLDRNVVAISPSSVFRVLQEAGLSSKWTVPDGQKAHRKGFYQPTRAHVTSGIRTLPMSIFGDPTPSSRACWTDTPDSLCIGTSEAP